MEHSLSIGLFEPGMTQLHRVGLAGLYMTLNSMDKKKLCGKKAGWSLSRDRVTLTWGEKGRTFFDGLFKGSFGIDKKGVISFSAHSVHRMGDIEKLQLHESILATFLQHNQNRKLKKEAVRLSFSLDDKQVSRDLRPILSYSHQDAAKLLFKSEDKLHSSIDLAGWVFPGGAVRHVAYSARTKISEPPGSFLCLLYAPVASLYYRLFHRGPDGKYDKRRNTAVVLPHVTDLESYSRCYRRYLSSPVERLYADGLGDAGLMALVTLKAGDSVEELGVNGCTVVTMGNVTWSSQQKTRTAVSTIEEVNERTLDLFQVAESCLKNRPVFKEGKLYIIPSLSRGLISENIAGDRSWYAGFRELMNSSVPAKNLSFEKGGLSDMVKEAPWPHEADKNFVEAVHLAIRSRYGSLASQAEQRGVMKRFDREYERIRTGLTRVKNAQTLMAELADLFSRGGVNKVLQQKWQELLPLFAGDEWQKARDLALLALASYKGRGAEQLEPEVNDNLLED